MSERYTGRTKIRRTLLGTGLSISALLSAGCSVLGEDEPRHPPTGPSIKPPSTSTEAANVPSTPNRPKSAINTKVLGIFPGYIDVNYKTNPDVLNVFRGSLGVFESNDQYAGVIRAGSAGEIAIRGFLVRPLVTQGESGRLYLTYQTEGQIAAGEGEFIYIPIAQKFEENFEVALKSDVFGENGTRLPPNICPRVPEGTSADELGVDQLVNPLYAEGTKLYLKNQAAAAISTEVLGDGYEKMSYTLCPDLFK